jgi:predicted PurR-regulated permease PerM
VLTFFGGFIPYIGSAVTTGLAVLVALAVGTTTDIVVMMAWTVVFNIVQGNFVAPLVYGSTLNLHPAVILLAIPAGSEIAGVLGMFLIVPFVAIFAAVLGPILALVADPGPLTAAEPSDAPEAADPEHEADSLAPRSTG